MSTYNLSFLVFLVLLYCHPYPRHMHERDIGCFCDNADGFVRTRFITMSATCIIIIIVIVIHIKCSDVQREE